MSLRDGRRGTYTRTRTGLVQSHRRIVVGLVASAAVLTTVWFFFVSGYWSVSTIEVNELKALDRGEVASTTFDILDRGPWKPWDTRSLFFISETDVAAQLRDRLFAESVIVDKVYPNILRLKIQERQRSVVLASKDQLLLVDTSGVVTGEADGALEDASRALLTGRSIAQPNHPPVILCELQELVTAGYQVADPDRTKHWLDTYEALQRAGLKFRYVILMEPASRTLRVKLEKGYDLILDLQTSIPAQIDSYKKFEVSQPKNIQIREYVDVRVPGKIFLK